MSSLKIVLHKKQRKDGTYPLCIRITKYRKSSFIFTEYSIKESDWDNATQRVKKSHPNSARLNNFLLKKLAETTDRALELETSKAHVSSSAVKQRVKPTNGSTFFAQADLYIEQLKKDGKLIDIALINLGSNILKNL